MVITLLKSLFVLLIACCCCSCMQVLGVKHLDAWGMKVDATQGFDVSAGVMQYDGANNKKTMNVRNTELTN